MVWWEYKDTGVSVCVMLGCLLGIERFFRNVMVFVCV